MVRHIVAIARVGDINQKHATTRDTRNETERRTRKRKKRMRPEAQAEYDRICTQITLKHGHVVSHNPSVYGWRLQRRMRYVHADGHIPGCTVLSHGNATEDHWEEFVGTFAEPTCETRHGFSVANVTCSCGFIQDRTVRYEGSVSEMTRAVFEYMFSEKGNLDGHQK